MTLHNIKKVKGWRATSAALTLLTLRWWEGLKRSWAEVKRSTSRMRAVTATAGRYTVPLASLKPTVLYTAEKGMQQSPGGEKEEKE